MDSERPAPPTPHIQRPFYLVAAMVLLWILGVESLLSGGTVVMMLREGVLEPTARGAVGDLREALADAWLAALGSVPQLSFPLGLAQALLASTLILAATFVLVGRPSSRGFAMQAALANAAFAVVQYVLLRHVRGAWVDVAVRTGAALKDPSLPLDPAQLARYFYWGHRLKLVVIEVGIPLLALLSLTRPRTKTYFAEAAAAAESAEEEP